MITLHKKHEKWKVALSWIVAHTLGVLLGLWLGALLNDNLWPHIDLPSNGPPIMILIDNPIQRLLLIGVSVGSLAGIAEWFILRRWSIDLRWWMGISIGAWVSGLIAPDVLRARLIDDVLLGASGGVIIGVAQWLVLRQYLAKAYWWIIAFIASGLMVGSWIPPNLSIGELFRFPIKYGLFGFITGLVTGITLIWLLDSQKLAEEATPQIA